MLRKETLKHALLNAANAIDCGGSDFTDSEYMEMVDGINKIVNTERKLSKYQASEYLGISTATFDNWVRNGKLPQGKKEAGFKEKFWTKSQLINYVNEKY